MGASIDFERLYSCLYVWGRSGARFGQSPSIMINISLKWQCVTLCLFSCRRPEAAATWQPCGVEGGCAPGARLHRSSSSGRCGKADCCHRWRGQHNNSAPSAGGGRGRSRRRRRKRWRQRLEERGERRGKGQPQHEQHNLCSLSLSPFLSLFLLKWEVEDEMVSKRLKAACDTFPLHFKTI